MTNTGHKPYRRFAKIRASLSASGYSATEKLLVALCILSLFSAFGDISLAGFSLVYIQLCRTKGARYFCCGASALYFVSTVTHTAFYIPYIAFVFLYMISDYLLENHALKAVYPPALVFAVTKGYVLSFGYETAYWIYFAAEMMAILFAPQAMTTGFEILKNNEDCHSGQNLSEVLCTLIITALSMDGIDIWGITVSTAFLLGTACMYGAKNNFQLSFAAVFVMFITQCQNDNFTIIFAGLGAIYCAGVLCIPKGIKGYIYYILTACGASVASIVYFNSFVFLSVTALSAAVCMAEEKLLKPTLRTENTDTELLGEEEYHSLKNKLEKLNRCFRFLGHTVIDISELVSHDYIPTSAEDLVAEDICRKCKNNVLCWQQQYSHTQSQFTTYAKGLQNSINADFDSQFYSRCNKTDQLKQSFEQHNRLVVTRRLIHSQGLHNQKILQNQFLSMARILQEISVQSNTAGVANTAFTHKINSFLQRAGVKVNYCICYQDKNRCIVSTRDFIGEEICRGLKSKLEILYSAKFSMPTKETEGENTVYIFSQLPMLGCECGVKSISRMKNCGDVCESFKVDEYFYVILADGMGTGNFAAAESKTVTVMLKNLLAAYVSVETAIEIVNTALNLKGTGQSCVAVDVLQINLHNGVCNLYKAGAAESYISDDGKMLCLYKDSLPVGILKETKFAHFGFVVNNGDTIILTSDGVELKQKEIDKIRLVNFKNSAQTVAEYILKDTERADDATVVVVKTERV